MQSNGLIERGEPHFVVIPLMAQGHVIPMLDLSRLLAGAGATVTFITTPVNTARLRPTIDRIRRSALPIRFLDLCFPTAAAGLPDGCENMDLIPSRSLFKPFIEALPLLRPQLDLHLTAAPPPDCIIFDSINSWAAAAARDHGIPHLVFHGPSCFYMLCYLLLERSQVLKTIVGDFDPFVIPGLPEPVEVMKAQVKLWSDGPGWEKIRGDFLAAEQSADGVVMNTFEELELSVLEKYRELTGKKVWSIGPLSIINEDVESQATRGEASSTDTQSMINWLDLKAPNSVMFVCFGSLVINSFSQLIEIGRGLELALSSSSSSSLSFIWVVKEAAKSEEVEKWLSEFEEKVTGRGMIIRGWAPQAMILTHVAVGGFMTHCGWNSTLEAVAAGVVMATWPRYIGDQFINEKFVVDVLKIGVSLGAKVPASLVNEMGGEVQVKGEDVGKAVERVMDGGKEGEERRRRAGELRERARNAMGEGGSSAESLKEMIQFARQQQNCNGMKFNKDVTIS